MAKMQDLRGKVALVTGASRGIGPLIARRLAREGVKLALVARSAEPLRALAAELGGAAVIPADLGDPGAIGGVAEAARAELGRIDILVNNAGVETFQHFHRADPAGMAQAIALNVTAPVLLTRELIPGMLARGEGHVVNLASVAGLAGTPYGAVYSATKAAILAFTASLRMEYAGSGVSASAVAPGFVHGAGMHEVHKQEVGESGPKILGATTAEAVAEAVLQAIWTDAPELIVNSAPLRPALALGRLLPRLSERITLAMSGAYMKRIADTRDGE